MNKKCGKCQQVKEIEFFNKNKSRKDGINFYCKSCQSLQTKEWRMQNKETFAKMQKRTQIMIKYGLSKDIYDEMSKNGCMVCGSFENLSVDHDHSCCEYKRDGKTCGKCIRGILCASCNFAEGRMKSNPDLILKLYKYVKKNQEKKENYFE